MTLSLDPKAKQFSDNFASEAMNIEEPNIVIPVNPEKPAFNMKSNTEIPQQKNQDPAVPLNMPKPSISKISSSQLKPWISNL